MTGRFTGTALFVLLWGAPGAATDLPATLSIPESEFELGEETHNPIPMPDLTGNPVQQMMDTLSLDMTGTLPDAVLEELLGASPYDFTDVVWGMEVTGNWTQNHTGTGTLQVTNFTEGRGASPQIDPERYSGERGFRMYNAQLATDGEHTFTLSAIFTPEPGGEAMGTEFDRTRGVFEVTWLCHMLEPGRTGCIDHDDEYYYTPLPALQSLHVQQRGDGYRMTFQARVIEHRRHRDRGHAFSEPSGRVGEVRGWVCDRASWEVAPESCDFRATSDRDIEDEYARNLLDEARRKTEEELETALTQAEDEAVEAEIARQVTEIERQMQQDTDDAVRRVEAELARVRAEVAQAELERQIRQQREEAVRRVEAELARVQAEVARAEEERRRQQLRDDAARRVEAEVARVQGEVARIQAEIDMDMATMRAEQERDAAIARAEESLAAAKAEMDAALSEDETGDP